MTNENLRLFVATAVAEWARPERTVVACHAPEAMVMMVPVGYLRLRDHLRERIDSSLTEY
jgi:hypothetical protein